MIVSTSNQATLSASTRREPDRLQEWKSPWAGAVLAPSRPLAKIAAHPAGASLCLAVGYVLICLLYGVLSSLAPVQEGMTVELWREMELRKLLAFMLVAGLAYFGFAWVLLRQTASSEGSVDSPSGRRVGAGSVTPLSDSTGQARQLAGGVRDITERQRAGLRGEAYGHRSLGLSRRLVEVQETERRRIARQLHDEIGQALTLVQLNLQTTLKGAGDSPSAPSLREGLEALNRVMDQVREMSLTVRPLMLDDLGLVPALEWYANRHVARTGTEVRLSLVPLNRRLDPVVETECFRIAQEALTNVIRHSRATRVELGLQIRGGRLELTVTDNGIGFDVNAVLERAARGSSLGVLSMQERAELAGGGLEILSRPGEGTTVRAWFTPRSATHAPQPQDN